MRIPPLAFWLSFATLVAAAPAGAQSSRREPAASAASAAQRSPRVDVDLPANSTYLEGPIIRATGVVSDGALKSLLDNGFPARLRYRVELWKSSGWFDDVKGTVEWDVVVRYEPLTKTYRVARYFRDRVETLGRFESYADAVAAVERPYRAPIAPRRSGDRHYYNVVLQVEVLSLTDLDELEQWLRGELRPAIRGKRNPGTALGRGVRTLVTRLLGGETRQYVQRSSTFRPRA